MISWELPFIPASLQVQFFHLFPNEQQIIRIDHHEVSLLQFRFNQLFSSSNTNHMKSGNLDSILTCDLIDFIYGHEFPQNKLVFGWRDHGYVCLSSVGQWFSLIYEQLSEQIGHRCKT